MIRLSTLLVAAGAPRARRGSRANPFRGKRTLGAPEELVDRVARAVARLATVPVYDTRPGHEGERVEGYRRFRPGLEKLLVDETFRLVRADGVAATFVVYAMAPPDVDFPGFVQGGVGTVPLGGERVPVVGVHVSSRAAFDDATWLSILRSFFAHELAHLVDPGRVHRRSKGVPSSTMAAIYAPPNEAAWKAYVNDPSEVVAHRHQVWHELTHNATVRAHVRRLLAAGWTRGRVASTILLSSTTWREIRRDLTPASRRRFQEMAAALVTEWLDGSPGVEGDSSSRRRTS